MKLPLIKFLYSILAFLLLAHIFSSSIYADYVLPYPGYMPGHKFYRVARLVDVLKKYWFWGSIASVKYHLMLADKYLVEAKTLFEYKQYLLGVDALRRSNKHIPLIARSLLSAKNEGKDVEKLKATVKEAMNVHIAMLEQVSKDLPANYRWTPEKQLPTTINFLELFQEGKKTRMEPLK